MDKYFRGLYKNGNELISDQHCNNSLYKNKLVFVKDGEHPRQSDHFYTISNYDTFLAEIDKHGQIEVWYQDCFYLFSYDEYKQEIIDNQNMNCYHIVPLEFRALFHALNDGSNKSSVFEQIGKIFEYISLIPDFKGLNINNYDGFNTKEELEKIKNNVK